VETDDAANAASNVVAADAGEGVLSGETLLMRMMEEADARRRR